MSRIPRWMVVVSVAVVVWLPTIHELESLRIGGDELPWIYHGQEAWRHLREWDWTAPYWHTADLMWGVASPTISKFLIGAGMDLRGESVELRPALKNNFRVDRELLSDEQIHAARFSSVVLAVVGALFYLWFVARLSGWWLACLATILMSLSPVWLAAARRAMTDIHGVALSIVAMTLFCVAFGVPHQVSIVKRALGFGVVGVALGLAVGSKFSAAPVAIGLGGVLAAGFVVDAGKGRWHRAVSWVVCAGAMTLFALATFVAPYPHLHEDPIPKLVDIQQSWVVLRDAQAEHNLRGYDSIYKPGWISVREFFETHLLPGNVARGFVALGVLTAFVAFRSKGVIARRASKGMTIVACVAAAWDPGRIVYSYAVWCGVFLTIQRIISGEGDRLSDLWQCVEGRTLLAVSGLSFAFILTSTYSTWARYYLPLFPLVHVVAAFGLRSLYQDFTSESRWIGVIFAVGGMLAIASDLACGPQYGHARMATLDSGRSGLSGVLWWSAAGLVASATGAVLARRVGALAGVCDWFKGRPLGGGL